MPTALFNTDIVAIADRPPATTLIDSDIVISSITATGNLAPITKANLKATLGINANSADIVTLYGDVSTLDTRVDDILVGQDLDPNKDAELLASRGIFPTLPDRLDDSDLVKETVANVDILKGTGWITESVKGNADAVALKESITNVDTLKGVGWVDETVVGNAITIATNLENITLKGGYFSPTDVMGLNGRDLVTVLGATGASADLICKDAFALLRAISSTGDFTGLRLGDYIDIPALSSGAISITNVPSEHTLRAVIVSFDHYYNTGDTAVGSNHVVMQFENAPITHNYNTTNVNAGGYAASGLYTWLHGDLQTAIISALGLTPLTVHRLLSSHTGWAWKDESVFLPTEVEVFGHQAWGRGGYYTGSSMQFPLFATNPKTKVKMYGGARSVWWIATDVSTSSTNFCSTTFGVSSDAGGASGINGIVPAFLI